MPPCPVIKVNRKLQSHPGRILQAIDLAGRKDWVTPPGKKKSHDLLKCSLRMKEVPNG